MPVRLFQTFINTNVIEETLTKRATALGVEEQSGIPQMGRPVPVVFGTRRIDGAVVFWQGVENNLKIISPLYYDKNRRFAETLLEVEQDENNLISLASQVSSGDPAGNNKVGDPFARPSQKRNFTRAYMISMRMLICVGPIDDIRLFLANNSQFRCYKWPRRVTWTSRLSLWLRYTPSGGDPVINADPQWERDVTRYIVSLDAGDLFGGYTGSGGLGLPRIKDSNPSFSFTSSRLLFRRKLFSEFYLCKGDPRSPNVPNYPHLRAEEGVQSLGTTSLCFSNFNFGGNAQLPRWRLAVQRVHKQTDYRPQWYPEKVVVQRGPLLENIFLMFVVPRHVDILYEAMRAIGEMVSNFERLSPPGQNVLTVQVLVYVPGNTVGATTKSGYIRTRAQFDAFSRRFHPIVFSTYSPGALWRNIMEAQVARNDYAKNFYGTGNTNQLRFGQGVRAPSRLREHTGIFLFWGECDPISDASLEKGKYWFEGLSVGSHVIIQGNPAASGFHTVTTQGYPDYIPDIRSVYYDTPSPHNNVTRTGRANAQAVIFDQPGEPKRLNREQGESPYDFMLNSTPTYTTMNPIHALRECLINKDWGAGIEESNIDDAGFRFAADICESDDERLGFCDIWDKLDPPDRFIQSILDYVDGMLYFDQLNDLWRLKLIRGDYDVDTIPLFNQTNVSELLRYKRQHTDQVVNSLTVKFFNIISDAEDAVTVHDLGRTSAVGNVVSVVQQHPGCPLRESAVRVANREFFALSRPLMSFDLVVETSAANHLGPGDPIKVQWVDLFDKVIVMRIMSIDHGDGKLGTVTLRCIQDTFANLQDLPPTISVDENTGVIDGEPTILPEPQNPIEFSGDVFFEEAHYTDALSVFPDQATLDRDLAGGRS